MLETVSRGQSSGTVPYMSGTGGRRRLFGPISFWPDAWNLPLAGAPFVPSVCASAGRDLVDEQNRSVAQPESPAPLRW
jgi:hypothetical protein